MKRTLKRELNSAWNCWEGTDSVSKRTSHGQKRLEGWFCWSMFCPGFSVVCWWWAGSLRSYQVNFFTGMLGEAVGFAILLLSTLAADRMKWQNVQCVSKAFTGGWHISLSLKASQHQFAQKKRCKQVETDSTLSFATSMAQLQQDLSSSLKISALKTEASGDCARTVPPVREIKCPSARLRKRQHTVQ